MTKGTLVYHENITIGELADDLMDVGRHSDTEDEDSQEAFNTDIGMQIDQEEMAPQSFFHTALEIRKLLKNSGGVDGWPPDSSDLTLENAIDSVPVRLFNFIAWSVGYSQDPIMDERVPVSHSQCCKVISICQDLIYAESKG